MKNGAFKSQNSISRVIQERRIKGRMSMRSVMVVASVVVEKLVITTSSSFVYEFVFQL